VDGAGLQPQSPNHEAREIFYVIHKIMNISERGQFNLRETWSRESLRSQDRHKSRIDKRIYNFPSQRNYRPKDNGDLKAM
jgi:hypothetical protein